MRSRDTLQKKMAPDIIKAGFLANGAYTDSKNELLMDVDTL